MAEVSGYNKGVTNQPVPGRPVNKPADIAQTGQIKPSQKVQKALEKGTEQTTQVVQKQQIETIARRMTTRDVVNQLLTLGIRPTAENRTLALKMLMYGLELSKENFQKIDDLLKGLNKNTFTQQAAIIAISKGINSKTAVQQLANFLENNPQLSNQLTALLNGINNVQSMLTGQTVLSATLTAELTAIMAALEGAIVALPGEIRRKINKGRGLLNQAELLTNMRAARSLLTGVGNQVNTKSATGMNNLLSAIGRLSGQAKEVAENLIVQAILSKPGERSDSAMNDKFAYWQIPNSLATPPETIELLVQRDKKKKNKTINPKRTKLIFKTVTKQLGEIAIEVDVEENNLDFKFNTKEDEVRKLINTQIQDLKKKLEAHNYKTRTVRVVKRNLDVKRFLIPTLDLDSLTRVQTEV